MPLSETALEDFILKIVALFAAVVGDRIATAPFLSFSLEIDTISFSGSFCYRYSAQNITILYESLKHYPAMAG
jgi:hypothetical protein